MNLSLFTARVLNDPLIKYRTFGWINAFAVCLPKMALMPIARTFFISPARLPCIYCPWHTIVMRAGADSDRGGAGSGRIGRTDERQC